MLKANLVPDPGETAVSQPARQRSRSYPIISISSAEKILREVLLADGPEESWRTHRLVRLLGYTAGSGIATRKISALRQYGILEKDHGDDIYGLSSKASLLLDENSPSWHSTMRSFFLNPPVFQEIFQMIVAAGSLPDDFAEYLRQHHDLLEITEAACDDVAEIFLESARYLKIIDGNTIIVDRPLGQTSPAVSDILTENKGNLQCRLPVIFRHGLRAMISIEIPYEIFNVEEPDMIAEIFSSSARQVVRHMEPRRTGPAEVHDLAERKRKA